MADDTETPLAPDAAQAQYARDAWAARLSKPVLGNKPPNSWEKPEPAEPSPEDENPYAAFRADKDTGDGGLAERARLNAVNSYYRGTIGGASRLAEMSRIVTTDDEKLNDSEKAIKPQWSKEYNGIVSDLARYDLMAPWGTSMEGLAALGGGFGGGLVSPESYLGWGSTGVTWLGRTLKAAVQQGGIQAAVDPLVQWMNINGGIQQEFSFADWAQRVGLGAIIGGGMHGILGELVPAARVRRTVGDLAREDPSFVGSTSAEAHVEAAAQATRAPPEPGAARAPEPATQPEPPPAPYEHLPEDTQRFIKDIQTQVEDGLLNHDEGRQKIADLVLDAHDKMAEGPPEEKPSEAKSARRFLKQQIDQLTEEGKEHYLTKDAVDGGSDKLVVDIAREQGWKPADEQPAEGAAEEPKPAKERPSLEPEPGKKVPSTAEALAQHFLATSKDPEDAVQWLTKLASGPHEKDYNEAAKLIQSGWKPGQKTPADLVAEAKGFLEQKGYPHFGFASDDEMMAQAKALGWKHPESSNQPALVQQAKEFLKQNSPWHPSAIDKAQDQTILDAAKGYGWQPPEEPTTAPPPPVKVEKPPVPPKQPEPRPLGMWGPDVTNPNDPGAWKKVGGQKGSNKGGTYEDSAGEKYYVKTPQTEDHARNELLANKLYVLAGADVPENLAINVGGKPSIASRMLPDSYDRLDQLVDGTKQKDKAIQKLRDNFAADAWLANYDVVGLTQDNVMVAPDGTPFRIDQGGALRYRAQGKPKTDFGSYPNEFFSMRDTAKAPQAGPIFKPMTDQDLVNSINRVLMVSDGQIYNAVDNLGPVEKDIAYNLAQTLIERKKTLKDIRDNLKQNIVTAQAKAAATAAAPPAKPTKFYMPIKWEKGQPEPVGPNIPNTPKLKSVAPVSQWNKVGGQDKQLAQTEGDVTGGIGKKASSGVVIQEPDGRVWIVKPKGEYGGYKFTFPKGGISKGLNPQANAIKEAFEETGLRVKITGLLGDFEGDSSNTRFYTGERIGGTPMDHGKEAEAVHLVSPSELYDYLNKPRDHAVAEKAYPGVLKVGQYGPGIAQPQKIKITSVQDSPQHYLKMNMGNVFTDAQVDAMSDDEALANAKKYGYKQPGEPTGEIPTAPDKSHPSGLPMDKVSRLKRAVQLGFDTAKVWYHATSSKFDAFDITKWKDEPAIFLSDSPVIAKKFGSKTYPMFTRAKNILTIEPTNGTSQHYGHYEFKKAIQQAKKDGYDAVLFKNVSDAGGIGDQLAILNTNTMRSIHAAFEPAEVEHPNLAAMKPGEGKYQSPEEFPRAYEDMMNETRDATVDAQERGEVTETPAAPEAPTPDEAKAFLKKNPNLDPEFIDKMDDATATELAQRWGYSNEQGAPEQMAAKPAFNGPTMPVKSYGSSQPLQPSVFDNRGASSAFRQQIADATKLIPEAHRKLLGNIKIYTAKKLEGVFGKDALKQMKEGIEEGALQGGFTLQDGSAMGLFETHPEKGFLGLNWNVKSPINVEHVTLHEIGHMMAVNGGLDKSYTDLVEDAVNRMTPAEKAKAGYLTHPQEAFAEMYAAAFAPNVDKFFGGMSRERVEQLFAEPLAHLRSTASGQGTPELQAMAQPRNAPPPQTPAQQQAAAVHDIAVRSLQQQVMDLATALDLPVRQGRVQIKGAVGQYNSTSGVARVNEIPDLMVVAHEAGHAIQQKVGPELTNLLTTYASELGRMDYDWPKTARPVEGFAEFVRHMIGNPTHAQKEAPGFFNRFKDFMSAKAPDILKALDDAAAGYRAYQNASPEQLTKANIRFASEESGAWKGMTDELKTNGMAKSVKAVMDKTSELVLDKNAPMAKAVRDLVRYIRTQIDPSFKLKAAENPDILLRLGGRSQQAARQDYQRGIRPYQQINVEGPALTDAISHAIGEPTSLGKWDDEKVKDFSTYLVARQGESRWRQYEAGDIPREPAAFSKQTAIDTMGALEAKYPQFKQASDMVHDYNKQLLRKLYEGHIISKEVYDDIKTEDYYAPFQRSMVDKPLIGQPGTGGGPQGPGMVKAIIGFKGSKRDIIDPLESIWNQTVKAEHLVQHNDAIRAMVTLSEKAVGYGGKYIEKLPAYEAKKYTFNLTDAMERKAIEQGMTPNDAKMLTSLYADQIGTPGDPLVGSYFRTEPTGEHGEPLVFYKENGQLQVARMSTSPEAQDLYKLLVAAPPPVKDLWLQMIGVAASVHRGGIVTNLTFALSNYIRDQLTAGLLRPDYIPFFSGIKGMISEARQSEPAQLYAYAGGVAGGAVVGHVERAADFEINALAKKGYLVNRVTSIKGAMELASFTEAATRNSIFETVFKAKKAQGLSDWEALIEGAYSAQDMLDFSRKGSGTYYITKMLPFLNAHMQGLNKAWRTIVAPISQRIAGAPVDSAEFNNAVYSAVKVVGFGSALGAAWAALNWDKEQYRDASTYFKGTHLIVPFGDRTILVPKPFELSAGFTAGEYAYQRFVQDDARAASQFADAVWQTLAPPNPIADMPVASLATELWLGKSMFTGRDIVPERLQGVEPAQQYTDKTSSLAKALGKVTGVSPIKIDYAIGSEFGTWGRDIMTMSQAVDPDAPEQALEDRVFVRRFIKDPTRTSDVTTRFWDYMARTTGKYNQDVSTYDSFVKQRSDVQARQYLAEKSAPERAFMILKSASDEDGKAAFNADEKRLHPLQRAYDAVELLNKLQQEVTDNNLTTWEDRERLNLSPTKRRDLMDNLRELKQMEMRNSFVIMKEPGYKNRALFDVNLPFQKIAKAAPQVAEEIANRYATSKIYTTKSVADAYPDMERELIREGSDADVAGYASDAKADGYEFDGYHVRRPPKGRAPIAGAPYP